MRAFTLGELLALMVVGSAVMLALAAALSACGSEIDAVVCRFPVDAGVGGTDGEVGDDSAVP